MSKHSSDKNLADLGSIIIIELITAISIYPPSITPLAYGAIILWHTILIIESKPDWVLGADGKAGNSSHPLILKKQ